jgi:hypothetical protein
MRILTVPVAVAAAALTLGACSNLPKPQLPFMGKPNNFAKMAEKPLPKPQVRMNRRVAEVRLPYRNREGRAWVVSGDPAAAGPFALSAMTVRLDKGPRGTDLAVYTYVAREAGSGELKFALLDMSAGANTPPPRVGEFTTTVTARR